jgi:hypothetical protein
MASLPVLYPPPIWTNRDIFLYHGTVDTYVPALTSKAVQVAVGKAGTDFGPGFYTTTVKRQAQMWAAQISAARSGTTPAVIEFIISRDYLAPLQTLAFARGDFDAEDFWSLIHHCRLGATDHGRSVSPRYYDVVYGPVAAFWNQRMIVADADQISFHTAAAEAVLNMNQGRRIL